MPSLLVTSTRTSSVTGPWEANVSRLERGNDTSVAPSSSAFASVITHWSAVCTVLGVDGPQAQTKRIGCSSPTVTTGVNVARLHGCAITGVACNLTSTLRVVVVVVVPVVVVAVTVVVVTSSEIDNGLV